MRTGSGGRFMLSGRMPPVTLRTTTPRSPGRRSGAATTCRLRCSTRVWAISVSILECRAYIRWPLGNPIEQDHRGIKQRYYPMLGFKALVTAAGFCRVSEEVRSYFRPRQKMGEAVSLGTRRELFNGRYLKLQDQFCVAV